MSAVEAGLVKAGLVKKGLVTAITLAGRRYFRRNSGGIDYGDLITPASVNVDSSARFLFLTGSNTSVEGLLIQDPSNGLFKWSDDSIRLYLGNSLIASIPAGEATNNTLNEITIDRPGTTVNLLLNGVIKGSGTSTATFSPRYIAGYFENSLNCKCIMADLIFADESVSPAKIMGDYPIDQAGDSTILVNRVGANGQLYNSLPSDVQQFTEMGRGLDWVGSVDLLPEGNFESAIGWNMNPAWSIANGQAIYDGVSAPVLLYRSVPRPAYYRLAFDCEGFGPDTKIQCYDGLRYPSSNWVKNSGKSVVDVKNDKVDYPFLTIAGNGSAEFKVNNLAMFEVLKVAS